MATTEQGLQRKGLAIERYFTREGLHPYDEVEWEVRDAVIPNHKDGGNAFEQRDVEFPKSWSVIATNIVAQKYFRGPLGTPQRERSVRQMIDRVVDTITQWGSKDGYFSSELSRETFNAELKHILVNQKAAFNSPVWFNVGVEEEPQCSACFILAVDDTMGSILNWYVEEGTIFKGGSGSGINLSTIRSSMEQLAAGGSASGPVSFMRGADASAGTIKSGGKTRRAAKMVVLNAEHPDVEDFIWCKAREEQKARALRDAGFDMDLDGRDSHSIQYQNANNSVRVTDEFMQAVLDDGDWALKAVTTGDVIATIRARELMRQMAQAAWECADPGMQYDTTINDWHTSSQTGRINASNPCSEYMHLDNSACNLASLNLLKFVDRDLNIDIPAFKHAVDVVFLAQEIIVGNSSYPTAKIAQNAKNFRELGLGYANLGALLMARGLAYDSDAGRALAGAITALMTGWAYRNSALFAEAVGAHAGYAVNREPMLRVISKHRAAVDGIDGDLVPEGLLSAARNSWDDALALGEKFGYRNAQASVLAPTGTIGLMMDCDTTGVEPDLALVKNKKLVGGGTMRIVNQTVPKALKRLGYTEQQATEIVAHIADHNNVAEAPHLLDEHKSVFDCAMGERPIHYMGHVKMMGAVQPFISGAISKCVTGDTLIPTEDGLIRIRSLHRGEAPDSFRDEHIALASLDGVQKTDAFYYGGVRPVRSVQLRSGQRIVGTPNHRLLTASEGGFAWKDLAEIGTGDLVAVQVGSNQWSALPARFNDFAPSARYGPQKEVRIPVEVSNELAFLLGAYVAEGHTSRSNWTIHITNADPDVLKRVISAWRNVFGVAAKITTSGDRCPQASIASKTVVEFLEYLGCGSHAPVKRIPDAILRSPREMVLAFLEGLSLDACVTVEPSAKWAICMASPHLLDDLQAILTNLGFLSSRVSKWNSEYERHYDEVYLAGKEAQRFAALVPFPETAKRERATRLIARSIKSNSATADLVPIAPRDLYEMLPKGKSGRNGHGVRAEFAYLCDPRTSRVTRQTLRRVAAAGASLPDWLRQTLADNLHFAPVTSVEDAGVNEVYDVSVPATKAFVGNGIVNHNTVNMPEHVTVEDVEGLLVESWKLGLKAVAIYRDNCKVAQPLSVDIKKKTRVPATHTLDENGKPVRRRLPKSRLSRTTSFRVADAEGYINAGMYEDGSLGEVFLKVAKQGSLLSGVMDALAISVSLGLQYGVPLEAYVQKFMNSRFEPAGMTDDPDIRFATSISDYVFRRLALDHLDAETRARLGIMTTDERRTLVNGEHPTGGNGNGGPKAEAPAEIPLASKPVPLDPPAPASSNVELEAIRLADAPVCYSCGEKMRPAGSCYVCEGCGSTSGCS